MKLSLILPVYNPAAGWSAIVMSNTDQLKASYPDIDFEILVVNDGSTNSYINEKDRIGSHGIKVVGYTTNKGKGEAVRTGIREATGDFFVYTDIDFPYSMSSVRSIIDRLLSAKADIVIGIKDNSYYDHVPPMRRFISRLFRSFIRIFFRIPTDDTQCGLKGFNQKGKTIFLKTTITRYLFDLEFVFLASRQRDVVLETQEVSLREDVQFSRMNFGILRNELWNFLKILLSH